LSFIDGMHKFEFALRDFANLERNSAPGSTILIHDCNPPTRESATPKQETFLWAGDVWKLIICLGKERPDLDISVVDVAPTGLAIIRSLDPSSTVLFDRQQQIIETYRGLDFSEFEQARETGINLVPNEWDQVRRLLPATPMRSDDPARLRRIRAARTLWEKSRMKVVSTLRRTPVTSS
jgi:hypothetical protein